MASSWHGGFRLSTYLEASSRHQIIFFVITIKTVNISVYVFFSSYHLLCCRAQKFLRSWSCNIQIASPCWEAFPLVFLTYSLVPVLSKSVSGAARCQRLSSRVFLYAAALREVLSCAKSRVEHLGHPRRVSFSHWLPMCSWALHFPTSVDMFTDGQDTTGS